MAMAVPEIAEEAEEAKAARKAAKAAKAEQTASTVALSPNGSNGSTGRAPSGGVWATLLLGLAMLVINDLVGTKVTPGLFFATFLYVVIGSLIPVVGIPVGAMIVLALLLRHATGFQSAVSRITSQSSSTSKGA